MSHTIEATPVTFQDDTERLDGREEMAAMRQQLDKRLSTPDLSDEERDVIIGGAMSSISTFLDKEPIEWGSAGYTEISRVVSWLSELTHSPVGDDGIYSKAHLQAMKYFSGTLFERIRAEEQDEGHLEQALRTAGMVQQVYLSMHPNISSYADGLNGQLEIVSYANRSEAGQKIANSISGDIIYWTSKGQSSELFARAITNKNDTPVAQLEMINTLTNLAHQAPQHGAWARPLAEEVSAGLQMVAGGQGRATPFVRLAAQSKSAEALSANSEVRLVEDYRARMAITSLDLNEDQAEFMKEIYNPNMRALIEQELSIKLSGLTVDAQLSLVTFMTEANNERYERLRRVLKETEADNRQQLAEAFLALEFGEDFGDILLNLVETENAQLLGSLFENIATVRESGKDVASLFESENALDHAIAEALPVAFTKRVTELLALANQEGIGAIDASLPKIAEATAGISSAVNRSAFKQVGVSSDVGSFRAEDIPVTITARPHGDNARLGFTISMDKQRLSLRLDYEDGRLSLDIGSTAKEGVNTSEIARQVGTDLARGERALAQLRTIENHPIFHGNHVRETFEHLPRIEPEEFAGIVNRFMYRFWHRDRLQ